MQVSRTAKDAFDSIVRSFQKTENGGVFDESPLAVAEKVCFPCNFQNLLGCLNGFEKRFDATR